MIRFGSTVCIPLVLTASFCLDLLAQDKSAKNDPESKEPSAVAPATADQPADFSKHVVVVIGAAGEKKYGEMFNEWAANWKKAAQSAGAHYTQIGGQTLTPSSPKQEKTDSADSSESDETKSNDGAPKADKEKQSDLEKLKSFFENLKDDKPVWLIMIGHGTYDGKTAGQVQFVRPGSFGSRYGKMAGADREPVDLD